MLALDLKFEDGSCRLFEAQMPVSVGRASDCDLRLKAWRVGRYHATIERRIAGVFIDDLGTLSGTFVNGRRISQYGPLTSSDEIIIGPCLIRMIDPDTFASTTPDDPDGGKGPAFPLHCVSRGPGYSGTNDREITVFIPAEQPSSTAPSATGPSQEHALLKRHGNATVPDVNLQNADHTGCDDPAPVPGATAHVSDKSADYVRHCRRLHAELLDALDLRRRDIGVMSDAALRSEAVMLLSEVLEKDQTLPATLDRAHLIRTVVDEAVGLGPLESLLEDTRVTEIMVNRHDEIFVEAEGRLYRHEGGFSSEQAVQGVIERIVSPLGRRIDESSPMVDARLHDGSRVNAVIPPIALRGSSITIRKFPVRRPEMADLQRVGALDLNIGRFLKECVIQRKNIIVSGGTGSGKTTLLNILSRCIPAGERIVTIEDAAELQLGHEHLVSLEARPANLEGKGAVYIRDLVRNALRMRPDRIVVGECRGPEAFDMLAAMNTGHEGSLTTLHANNPRDALSRLETMILMAGMDLPLAAIRDQVSSSVDIIVQQARLSSGHRVITSVVQVTGQESGRIQLQELFRYQAGPPALFVGCGILPEGIALDSGGLSIEMFNRRTEVNASTTSW